MPSFDLVSSDGLVGAVKRDHIDLQRSNRVTIRKGRLSASVQVLRVGQRVSLARNFEHLVIPNRMAIAFAKALPESKFEDATMPLVGRTDNACGARVSNASNWVLDWLSATHCREGAPFSRVQFRRCASTRPTSSHPEVIERWRPCWRPRLCW
jgi:hypothetical protein